MNRQGSLKNRVRKGSFWPLLKEKEPLVYLCIDRASCGGRDLLYVLERAICGGVGVVQLREKEIETREYVKLGKRIKGFLKERGVPFIINDRVDVAMAVGADGVHVGQEDLHPIDVRRIVGENMLIGLSVNTPLQALEAELLPVDYIGVGPVFPTSTKKDAKPLLHIEGLKNILKMTTHPVIAIGGITPRNCSSLASLPLAGVAVVSAICSAPNPYEAAAYLKLCLSSCRKSHL